MIPDLFFLPPDALAHPDAPPPPLWLLWLQLGVAGAATLVISVAWTLR